MEELINRLNSEFVDTGKFSNIASMFVEGKYKELANSDIETALEQYLGQNKTYLNNLSNRRNLNLDLSQVNEDELNYSLFVNGVGKTLKLLQVKDKNLFSSIESSIPEFDLAEVIVTASRKASSEMVKEEQVHQQEQGGKIENVGGLDDFFAAFDKADENYQEAHTSAEVKAEQETERNRKDFEQNYNQTYPEFQATGQAFALLNAGYIAGSSNKPFILGGQGALRLSDDYTDKEKAFEFRLEKRKLDIARSGVNLNLATSGRPAYELNTQLLNPTSALYYDPKTYIRVLDANLDFDLSNLNKFDGLENFDVNKLNQFSLTAGVNTYFHPSMEAQKILNPGGLTRCACTGIVCMDNVEMPLYSGVHMMDSNFYEYGQLFNLRYRNPNTEISLGYKPEQINLSHFNIPDLLNGDRATPIQSATYTGYFANIDFNEEGKENRVDYLSFAVRPDAMNHFNIGTVGKTDGDRRIGYEAGLDIELGNKPNPETNEAIREARTLLNAGLHFPLNDKYGMQRGALSTVIQPSYNFMQNAADIGIRLHGEYNISNDNNAKLIGGASYSTENNIGLQGYLGVQKNFNKDK